MPDIHDILVHRHQQLILLLLSFSVLSLYQPAAAAQVPVDRNLETISPTTTSGLEAFYQALDYDWRDLDEEGVPPFILQSIPGDINKAVTTKEKKRAFFMGLLPMVLLANHEIKKERNEVLQILSNHKESKNGAEELRRLEEIANRYGLRGKPLTDHRARSNLLQRVNVIPPSLVLAQAANESAWGTSRFARQGNNIFGEWTFKPGTGIVPAGRPDGAIYEVRKFSSIYQSIRSYMRNLNTHSAYRKLREIRARLLSQGEPLTGTALAGGLSSYSERGDEYIVEIKSMIRQNRLERINAAMLRQPETEPMTSLSSTGAGLLSSRNRIIGHRTLPGEYP